jgi:hypothetical protein
MAGAAGSSRQVPTSGGAGTGVEGPAAEVPGTDAGAAGLAGDPGVAGRIGV